MPTPLNPNNLNGQIPNSGYGSYGTGQADPQPPVSTGVATPASANKGFTNDPATGLGFSNNPSGQNTNPILPRVTPPDSAANGNTYQTAQYDASGNLTGYKNNTTGVITPAGTSQPTSSGDPATNYATGGSFQAPESEDQTYQELLDRASGQINDINKSYQDELQVAQSGAAGLLNASGLSDTGAGAEIYSQQQQPIIDARNQALDQVYQDVQKNADSLYEYNRSTADSEASADVAQQQQIKAQALSQATDQIKSLAANHFDYNAAQVPGSPNYQTYQNLLASVGGDPNVLDAMFAMSAPAENVQNTYYTSDGSGGTTVNQVVQDPVTGKISHQNYDIPGINIPNNWTPYKLGTNATRFESPNYNPQDPSTYSDVSVDPTNSGAVTVTSNGITTVNGIPINNNPSDTSSASGQTTTTDGAAPKVADLIGLGDPTQPLSSVVGNINIGVDGIVNGIIANEGGSPKGVINNPGNIKFFGQTGATDSGVKATDGGTFASFPTKQDGVKAIGDLVQKASDSGQTFDQFVNKYTGTTPTAQSKDFAINANPPSDSDSSNIYVTPNGVNTGLTHAAIYQDAMEYAADNEKLPATGVGSSAQAKAIRESIQNKSAAILSALGMTEPQFSQAYKSDSAAVTQNVERLAKIDSTSKSLTVQFPRLAQLADSIGTGVTESDIEKGAAYAAEKTGSPDAASYVELIQTVRSDYAAMQAGVAGGRGGQFFAQNAEDAIPAGLTGQQYLAIQKTIEGSATNSAAAIKSTVSDLASNSNPNGSNSSASSSDSSAVVSQITSSGGKDNGDGTYTMTDGTIVTAN